MNFADGRDPATLTTADRALPIYLSGAETQQIVDLIRTATLGNPELGAAARKALRALGER